VFAGTCAGLFLISLLISPAGAISPLDYFTGRPFQIESVPASALWALSLLGLPICSGFEFSSLDVYERVHGTCPTLPGQSSGSATDALSLLFLALLLAGVVWVVWMQWRGRLTLAQAFISILLIIIATGKVFSPQYLIWLAPLLAYTIGFGDLFWFVCWCGVSLLTTVIYPYLYGVKHDITDAPSVPAFYPTIALRNLLLVLLVAVYLFDVFRLRSRAASKRDLAHESAYGGSVILHSSEC